MGEVAKPGKYTFQIDEESSKSDWVYCSTSLGINCGEECGYVYANAMGGYGKDRENKIFVHGKDENGRDDFKNQFTVDWDDRDDQSILDTIGNQCFYRAGLKKDSEGKTVTEYFLSAYDFIKYLKQNLEEGMKVSVNGNLKYQFRNGNVQVQKEIRSVYLADYVESQNDYEATFRQTILFDKDCLDIKDYDVDKGVLNIPGYCVDYLRDYNGKEVKSNYPFKVNFEYKINNKAENFAKVVNMLFKVKKGVDEIVFNGKLIEGGAVVQATYDDLDDDIKTMVDVGIIPLEEAVSKCSVSSSRERRMVLTTPNIRAKTQEDGTTVNTLEIERNKYEEEDLEFVLPSEDEETEEESQEMKTVEPISEEEDEDLAALLAGLGAE